MGNMERPFPNLSGDRARIGIIILRTYLKAPSKFLAPWLKITHDKSRVLKIQTHNYAHMW